MRIGYPVKHFEPFQIEGLKEIASERRARVSTKSYHGAGKTMFAAMAAAWFFMTRPNAHVIVTAPVEQQVKDHFFSNLATLIQQSNYKDLLMPYLYTMRLEMPGHTKTWYIQGRVSNRAVNIEGYHGPHVLYIVDEAKGVPYEIFQAIEGALTNDEGDVLVLLISTPSLNPSGYFYDTWKSKKMKGMYKLVNVGPEGSTRVSNAWREARLKEWGEKSPVYQARVLGEFPDQAEGTLFPASMVEAATMLDLRPGKWVAIGADIARFGDDKSVFFPRFGDVLQMPHEYEKQDTMTTADNLRLLALQLQANELNIDDSGVGGGVVDRMNQLKAQFNDPWTINQVDNGAGSSNPDRFRDLKAELAWGLRKRFEEGRISLPDHGTLIADLLAYKYDYNRKDQMYVVDKQTMKHDIGRSPDFGDAAILAFYEPSIRKVHPKIHYYDAEEGRVVSI